MTTPGARSPETNRESNLCGMHLRVSRSHLKCSSLRFNCHGLGILIGDSKLIDHLFVRTSTKPESVRESSGRSTIAKAPLLQVSGAVWYPRQSPTEDEIRLLVAQIACGDPIHSTTSLG